MKLPIRVEWGKGWRKFGAAKDGRVYGKEGNKSEPDIERIKRTEEKRMSREKKMREEQTGAATRREGYEARCEDESVPEGR